MAFRGQKRHLGATRERIGGLLNDYLSEAALEPARMGGHPVGDLPLRRPTVIQARGDRSPHGIVQAAARLHLLDHGGSSIMLKTRRIATSRRGQ
jgi:hypothetical protein